MKAIKAKYYAILQQISYLPLQTIKNKTFFPPLRQQQIAWDLINLYTHKKITITLFASIILPLWLVANMLDEDYHQ